MDKSVDYGVYVRVLSELYYRLERSWIPVLILPLSTLFVPVLITIGLICGTTASVALADEAVEEGGSSEFCASESDLAALNARVLQTELMVAALSCDERERYNNFITFYRSVLTERIQALQGMFKRAYGGEGTDRLNSFVTRMANNSSQKVNDKGTSYCTEAGELFKEALANKPSDLNLLASKPWIEDRHGYRPCVLEASRRPTG